jgi:YbbR domain-containing protein
MDRQEFEGVEAGFFRPLRGKALLKLLSLVLAFALWLFVTGEREDEVILHVPIQISNIPAHLVTVGEPPRAVQVQLAGSRSLFPFLFREDLQLRVDGSRLKPGKNTLDLRYADINLSRGIAVKAIEPEKVTVVLDERIERSVRVVPELGGIPRDVSLKVVEVFPPIVRLSGPKSLVGKVSIVHTQPIWPAMSETAGEVVIKACPLDKDRLPLGVAATPADVTVRLIYEDLSHDNAENVPNTS